MVVRREPPKVCAVTPSGRSSSTPARSTTCRSSAGSQFFTRFSVDDAQAGAPAGTALITTRTSERYPSGPGTLDQVSKLRRRRTFTWYDPGPPPRPRVEAVDGLVPARSTVLTIVDQGASSVSNFSRSPSSWRTTARPARLGVFAILTTTYVLSQGLVRSLSSDCLLTRSESDGTRRARYERGGYLAALVLSVTLTTVLLAVSGVLPGAFTLPLVIFAIFSRSWRVEDYSRFIGINRSTPPTPSASTSSGSSSSWWPPSARAARPHHAAVAVGAWSGAGGWLGRGRCGPPGRLGPAAPPAVLGQSDGGSAFASPAS